MGELFDLLIGLVSIVVVALLVIGAVLGWRTWSRTSELERRIKSVEADLRDLRRQSPPASPTPTPVAPPVAPAPRVAAPSLPAVPPDPIALAEPRVEVLANPPPLPAAQAPRETSRAPSANALASAGPPAKFELERWLGVRGAAVLGGVFLIVAGFLFLQYSIERNWVTPSVRLITGAISGATCLVLARFLRKRGYVVLSNSLSGAGIVLLYAVSWAAHRLYGVIEFPAAFAAMVAITALCATLSYVHASQLIAVLGLLGGFATPLVLSTGADRPLGLFGYALLLDLGFLFVAHRRRWPTIGMVALAGTFVIQGLWIAGRMDGPHLAIGVGALMVFGLLFAIFAGLQPAAERRRWIPSQIAALLLPFAFALYFAQHVDFGFHLVPLALLAGVMMLAGGILGQLQKTPRISLGTVSGALALVLVWTVSNAHALANDRALELVICALVLSAIELGLAEWERRKTPEVRGAALAAAVACLGLLLACAGAAAVVIDVPQSIWIAALVLLPLALLRVHSFGVHVSAALLGVFVCGASFAIRANLAEPDPAHTGSLHLAFILLAVGLLFLAAARLLRVEVRRSAFFATAAFFPMAQSALCHGPSADEPAPAALVLAMFALGLALALAANGARSSLLFAAAVGSTLWAHIAGARIDIAFHVQSSGWAALMGSLCAGLAAFTLWPFFAPAAMAARVGVWRVAAACSLPWFMLVHLLWVERHGGKLGFAMPLAFALFLGACARVLWVRGEPEAEASIRAQERDGARASAIHRQSLARCWFGAVAALYASYVLPLYLDPRPELSDRYPLSVGAALYALALAAWWLKSDHRGLKYVAALMAFLATWSLCTSAAFDQHERADLRVFNAFGYWLALPALALLLGAFLLGRREFSRLRGFEVQAQPRGFVPATAVLAACGGLLSFAWVNLEVADAFSQAPTFRWTLHGEPRANLAQSIAWALFALTLLVLGVSRRLGALRWSSLFLFLATIAKVFLFDLAHLGGLYRVGSILGLALSLLLVSFLYQRFVFRPAKLAKNPD